MMHLHYVQCLLRALGEPADFTLPERSAGSDNWRFEGWRARTGPAEPQQATEVSVDALTLATVKRFVLYEATDALQDTEPFGSTMTQLFDQLHDFEVEYRLEEALLNVPAQQRKKLRAELLNILRNLLPGKKQARPKRAAARLARPPVFDQVQFQSIADLYKREILPRYRDAFILGQVVNNNDDLDYEIGDPDRWWLPVGPIRRDKNFERQEQHNIRDPLANYATVDHIIQQIVDEGEGVTDFVEAAQEILPKVKELGGVAAFLSAVHVDKDFIGATNPPPWLVRVQRARNSHLYRLAMIRAQFEAEQRLADACGEDFTLRILAATAAWARGARAKVDELASDPTERVVIGRRLQALSILDEFQRQIVYREHGGYSGAEADDSYLCREPNKYEEAPLGAVAESPPLFAESLVLRLRFSGRCLVQLATDPDPPTDEAGRRRRRHPRQRQRRQRTQRPHRSRTPHSPRELPRQSRSPLP